MEFESVFVEGSFKNFVSKKQYLSDRRSACIISAVTAGEESVLSM
jgi:hypothetical protein